MLCKKKETQKWVGAGSRFYRILGDRKIGAAMKKVTDAQSAVGGHRERENTVYITLTVTDVTHHTGTGAMFVGAQKKLPKKERGRKEKGEDYISSHLIKSSH